MNKKIRCFTLLKNINFRKNYQTSILLKKILHNYSQAKTQLNILIGYQKEYSQYLNKQLTSSISGMKLINFYNFIFFLINGIERQKNVLQECIKQYNKEILKWKQNKINIQVWDKIISNLLLNQSNKIQLLKDYEVELLFVRKLILEF
ncbi:MAG: flagellar FliJ family protein [Buchnera aphidicola (Chaetogeoica yunlongensis)]